MNGIRIMTLALALVAAPAVAGWQVDRNVDELTDEGSVVAIYEAGGAAVGIVCATGTGWMQTNVLFPGFLNSGDDPVLVLHRVDKGNLQSANWTAFNQNNRIAFLAGHAAAKFARGLLGGRVLIAEATAYDGERHRVRVSLDGADGPVMAALGACGQTPEQVEARRIVEQEEAKRRQEEANRQAVESRRLFEERQRERREANERYEAERKRKGLPVSAEQAEANRRATESRQRFEARRVRPGGVKPDQRRWNRLKAKVNYTQADGTGEQAGEYRPARDSGEAASRIGKVVDETGADNPPAYPPAVPVVREAESSWNWMPFDLGFELERRPTEVGAPAAGAPWAPGGE